MESTQAHPFYSFSNETKESVPNNIIIPIQLITITHNHNSRTEK
jgi:hypothetical protein